MEEARAPAGRGRAGKTGVMVGFDLMRVNLGRLRGLPRLLRPLADTATALEWTMPDAEDALA